METINNSEKKKKYKMVLNHKKISNVEFDKYVKNIMRELSKTYMIEKRIDKMDEFNRYSGAIIKYR